MWRSISWSIVVLVRLWKESEWLSETMNPHRWGRGLQGSLILFDTHAFAPQRQLRAREMPSPSAFLLVSVNFTSPPGIPLPSTLLKPNPNSIHIVSQRHSVVVLQHCSIAMSVTNYRLVQSSPLAEVIPCQLTVLSHLATNIITLLSLFYYFVNKMKKWKKNNDITHCKQCVDWSSHCRQCVDWSSHCRQCVDRSRD